MPPKAPFPNQGAYFTYNLKLKTFDWGRCGGGSEELGLSEVLFTLLRRKPSGELFLVQNGKITVVIQTLLHFVSHWKATFQPH
jgi:hypothetical protein